MKFLVKVSQFEYIIMTEKDIFYVKIAPPLKNEILSSPSLPCFENLVEGSSPTSQ